MNIKTILLAGNFPISALLILVSASFYIGHELGADAPKVAVGERGAVVLDAVLDRPGASKEQLHQEVTAPILEVLKQYADQGYVVIDSSKDEAGNYSVAALPRETIDITAALRASVKKPKTEAKP